MAINSDADGFAVRCESLLQAFRNIAELTVLALVETSEELPSTPGFLSDYETLTIPLVHRPGSRLDRFKRLVSRVVGLPAPELRTVRRRALELDADLIVFLCPRHPDLAAVHSRRMPKCVLFAEEYSPNGPDNWGYATGLLGVIEAWSLRFALRRLSAVSVISANESEWCRAALGWDPIVVPHSIDEKHWVGAVERHTQGPPLILAVGNFSTFRNAEGLEAVFAQIARSTVRPNWKICVVSGHGIHPSLEPFREFDFADFRGAVSDVRALYDECVASLIPSRSVRGVKTTLLQAWATGCPVIASQEAAHSVGGIHGVDLLSYAHPDEAIVRINEVVAGRIDLSGIVQAGKASFASRFGSSAVASSIGMLMEVAFDE